MHRNILNPLLPPALGMNPFLAWSSVTDLNLNIPLPLTVLPTNVAPFTFEYNQSPLVKPSVMNEVLFFAKSTAIMGAIILLVASA